MKPAWDKLTKEFADHKTILIADVDCDGKGRELCEKHNIEGFPTLRHGSPDALEDYDGEREYDDLQKFAVTLKPSCSPNALEHCTPEDKAEMEKFMAMSKEDLQKQYDEVQGKFDKVEADFEADVEKLQSRYDDLEKTKKTKVAALETTGFKTLKKVYVHKGGTLKVREPKDEGGEGEEGEEGDMGEEGDYPEDGPGDKKEL